MFACFLSITQSVTCLAYRPENKTFQIDWRNWHLFCFQVPVLEAGLSFKPTQYLVSDEIKSQPDAKQWCSDREGDLVKINSAEENDFVLQLVRQKAPSLKQVWIGLGRSGNRFYWSDQPVPVYYSWAAGEPTRQYIETCGHMYVGGHLNEIPGRASGSWNDMGCQGHPKYPNGIVWKRLP